MMHTATVDTAQRGPGMLIETQARCICTNAACDDREIRETYANVDRATGLQTITAYCSSCRRVYRVKRRIVNGEWMPIGGVEIVTAPVEIASVMRRLEHIRGETRVKHYPNEAQTTTVSPTP